METGEVDFCEVKDTGAVFIPNTKAHGFLTLEPNTIVVYMVEGEYKFDPTKLRKAHEWCQSQIELAMINNHVTAGLDNSDIVVSNTFTQAWEMDAYNELAKQYGYRVFSIIVENRHGGVNQHNVPEDKLQMMKERFEVKL